MARLLVNGAEHPVELRPGTTLMPGTTLLEALRDGLGLTGTKYGCGEGECGACTVLVDGAPVRSCMLPADEVGERAVVTIEGLSAGGRLHPVADAFVAARALQCGYCTPGMVLAAVDLLNRDPSPDEATIRTALAGNICRCGGYPRIIEAVQAAARSLAAGSLPTDESSVDSPGGPAGSGPDDAAEDSGWTAWLRLDDGVHRGWGWSTPGGFSLTIGVDGRVVGVTGKVDGGQGNRHSLTRAVAAELGVSTSGVTLEMGDTAVAALDFGTFGSRSTPDAGQGLRLLARALRAQLLEAAAEHLGCGPDELDAADAVVRQRGHDRTVPYGHLVATGRRSIEVDPDEPLPASSPGLADLDDASLRRTLTAAVTGAKRFPSDVSRPGLWHGVVLRPPAHGALRQSVDPTAARARPDVCVVVEDDFVGVAAPTRAAAREALGLIRVQWQTTPEPSSDEIADHLRAHPTDGGGGWQTSAGRDIGDVEAALSAAEVRLDASYTTAYIAHVPMEPRVALADWDGESMTVWAGTQRPFAVRGDVAKAVGLDDAQVRVVVPDFGGGFGGKHTADVATEAARLAYACGHPVRVGWTRAEEFAWAYLRPAAVIDVRAGATSSGDLAAWDFTNINSGAAGLSAPYDVPNLRERYQPAASPLPQGSYRALAATANTFARESHVDDLAARLAVDPVEWRLRHLTDPRLAHALQTLADRVGWSSRSRRPGYGLGLACGLEKDARVATAAEVELTADGTLRLLRIVTCFDCGAIVDPTGLRNQVTGATIMGLGGALFERIVVERGEIRSTSFSTYRVPRFPDIPPIDVVLIDQPECVSAGGGETPIIAVAPAVGNAIFAATGRRRRDLPFDLV